MKSSTKIICAIALPAALAFSAAAQADGHMSKKSKGFYVGAAGVALFVDDFDFTNGRSSSNVVHTIEWDTGWGGVLRGGYNYGSTAIGNVRAEVELGARRVDIDNILDQANPSGDTMLYSGMINGAWDFDTGTEFTPYLLLGLGFAAADGDLAYDKDNPTSGPTQQDKDFAGIIPAGQLGAGVGYAINESIDATAGYSFMAAPTDDSGASETLLVHSVLLGLNYKF